MHLEESGKAFGFFPYKILKIKKMPSSHFKMEQFVGGRKDESVIKRSW